MNLCFSTKLANAGCRLKGNGSLKILTSGVSEALKIHKVDANSLKPGWADV